LFYIYLLTKSGWDHLRSVTLVDLHNLTKPIALGYVFAFKLVAIVTNGKAMGIGGSGIKEEC
jgi:hypothetical protein